MKSLALAAATAVLFAGCARQQPAEAEREARPTRQVTVVQAAESEWPEVYEATGTVRAKTSSVVSSRVMGSVREVAVRAGDPVAAGQVLVRLEAEGLDAAVRQAEAGLNEARSAGPEVASAVAAASAQLELAQATFNRMQTLFGKGSISNQEFDEAAAARKLAEANLAMAQARQTQLAAKIEQAQQSVRAARIQGAYTELTAPFAGLVTERVVEPGMIASPGMPLLIIEQTGALRLEAAVEEGRRQSVRVGQNVEVHLDGLDRTLGGRVAEIVPAVDAASRTVTVKIDLPAVAGLASGAFGRASFATGKRTAMAIPAAAVQQRGQLQMVYVAAGGAARMRMVTLGAQLDGQLEVLSGLSPGEALVNPIPAGLADGDPIEVRP